MAACQGACLSVSAGFEMRLLINLGMDMGDSCLWALSVVH